MHQYRKNKVQKQKRKKELDSIKALYNDGKYAKAQSEIIFYLQEYPNDSYGTLLYGKILMKLHEKEAAKQIFLSLYQNNSPVKYTALSNYATVLYQEKDFERAKEYYYQVIQESPYEETFAIINLARIYRKEGNYEKSEEILNFAHSEAERINVERLQLKINQGLFQEALEDAELLKENVSSDELVLAKAKIFIQSHQEEEALQILNDLIHNSKEERIRCNATYEKVKLQLKRDNLQEVQEGCSYLLKQKRDYEKQVYLCLGIAYHKREEYYQAITNYQEALNSFYPVICEEAKANLEDAYQKKKYRSY